MKDKKEKSNGSNGKKCVPGKKSEATTSRHKKAERIPIVSSRVTRSSSRHANKTDKAPTSSSASKKLKSYIIRPVNTLNSNPTGSSSKSNKKSSSHKHVNTADDNESGSSTSSSDRSRSTSKDRIPLCERLRIGRRRYNKFEPSEGYELYMQSRALAAGTPKIPKINFSHQLLQRQCQYLAIGNLSGSNSKAEPDSNSRRASVPSSRTTIPDSNLRRTVPDSYSRSRLPQAPPPPRIGRLWTPSSSPEIQNPTISSNVSSPSPPDYGRRQVSDSEISRKITNNGKTCTVPPNNIYQASDSEDSPMNQDHNDGGVKSYSMVFENEDEDINNVLDLTISKAELDYDATWMFQPSDYIPRPRYQDGDNNGYGE